MGSPRFDAENQLCSAQAFTGAGTVSQNSYDKQTAAADPSIGRLMGMGVFPTVAAGAGSSHTLEIIQADDGALTTNINSVASVVVPAASLKPGHPVFLVAPQGVLNQRYLGFRETSTGGTTTVTLNVYWMPYDEFPVYKSFVNVTPTI